MQAIYSKKVMTTMILVAAAMSLPAFAQDFKVGFINTDRIFRDANSAKAAQAKLEQEFSRREKAGKGCQITANFGLMQENKTEKCNKNTSWLIAGRIEKRDGGIRLSLT